jgi:succinate dehydrogenase / fumarate reductase membrane anchor subunit
MAQTTTPQAISSPKSGENAWLWMIKILTGPLLVVLLGIHLVVNHFAAQAGLLTYADVVAYYRNPIIPIMEIAFLITAVIHSLIGLRGILLDLKPRRGALKVIDWLFVIAGVFAITYGIWLVLTIAAKGP